MNKICFFGIYYRDYPRNQVLLRGFEENNYQIIHCNIDPRAKRGLSKYWALYKESKKLKGQKFDFVWVAFPGHTCMWLAKILFPRNTIIFDIFISQYEANVEDRKVHNKWGFLALKDWLLDWYSIRLSDINVLDTDEQIKLFKRNYDIDQNKTTRIFLSSALPIEEKSKEISSGETLVHFHGSFIPLHGVEYIIKAAKILEGKSNIKFRLVGGGQMLEEMKTLAEALNLKNIEFTGRVQEYNDVLDYLDKSDIMLGMFAKSGRGHFIIPNKIFEGMVYGKAIITADTPAIRELLTDRENVLYVKPGDEKDLAAKINELSEDVNLRVKIGSGAKELFRNKLSPKMLIGDFLDELKNKI